MTPFIDLHEDIVLHQKERKADQPLQTSFELIEDSSVRLVVGSIFVVPPQENFFHETTPQLISEELDQYLSECSKRNIEIVRTAEDVTNLEAAARPKLLVHLEGLNVFSGTDEDWRLLDDWYTKGLRSLGIMWNPKNACGGGADDTTSGLTSLGEEVLRWCEEKGVLFDCAHMNDKTFADVARLSKRPLYVSHGAVRAFCDRPRNSTDEQIKQIGASGGLIGLFLSNGFLAPKGARVTIDTVCDHIDHIKNSIGIDHIALGSDFGGVLSGLPEGLSSITDTENLWNTLARRGYSQDDIEKIAFGNALRMLKATLPR